MGAGKSTVGAEVARLVERPFVDVDREIERAHGPISSLFERGEREFRRIEEETLAHVLAGPPAIVALGGGALGSERTRERLGSLGAFVVLIDVEVDEAWKRASGSDRPLARDETAFRRLYEERRRLYEDAADAVATDADGVLLAALGIVLDRGALARLEEHVPRGRPVALVADGRVLELHRPRLDARVHVVPSGEAAKSLAAVERLWNELALDRGGVVVALGGGCTTDAAGFVAATYLRGLAWVAVPTTLVAQVDAAIGGKTAVNLGKGKNLVGAFHLPERVVVDPAVLATLPARERRAGMAEVVKTGLLAGRTLWTGPEDEMVRRAAAYKAAVCLSDPLEKGRRSVLNLGHTFAHALEAASGYGLRHGEAVALGLTAALRLSIEHLGLEPDVLEEVERVLEPKPVRVDPDVAWSALARDKKAKGGRIRLVLLEAPGKPVFPVEFPEGEVRAALEALVAH